MPSKAIIQYGNGYNVTKIRLITPPDILYNNTYSIVLICPSKGLKLELQKHLETIEFDVNVYVLENDNIDIKWLLTLIKQSNIVIYDVDNSDNVVKNFTSYLISHDNVFWLTNTEYLYYNILSDNRQYNLDFLSDTFGGYIEKKQQHQ